MDATGGIMMCKLKGQMEKGGYYDVEKRKNANRMQYDVQIKRANG